jgi:hypothetical protein
LPLPDLREDDLEVKRIYLLHRAQGTGIGVRLMKEAVAFALLGAVRGCSSASTRKTLRRSPSTSDSASHAWARGVFAWAATITMTSFLDSMSAERPVGVFDSGVGGLSVLRAIRQELPEEDLLYVGDSGFAPYGNKPGTFVRERAAAIVEFLINEGAKAIVVACNTATGIAVDELRARFKVPIVAVEPAVKPAASARSPE